MLKERESTSSKGWEMEVGKGNKKREPERVNVSTVFFIKVRL